MVAQSVKLVGNSHAGRVIKDTNELSYMRPNFRFLECTSIMTRLSALPNLGVSPRLLSRAEAAVYCGVSVPTFMVICPIPPVALGKGKRLERYDIRSLDEWLDKLGNDGASLNNDWLAKLDFKNDGRSRERS